MIVILLTSSKSISYDIDKNNKVQNDNEYVFSVNEDNENSSKIIPNKLNVNEFNDKFSLEEKKDDLEEKIGKTDKFINKDKKIILEKENNKEFDSLDKNNTLKPKKNIKTQKNENKYIIKKGDNLWNIARKYDISLNRLLKYNNINNPNLIHPGQALIIPSTSVIKNIKTDTISYNKKNNKVKSTRRIKKKYSKKFKFIWPAKGRITSEFGVRRSPYNKKMEFHTGIDIACKLGKNFTAAERGKVIFSGIRRGYGKTIIIQHKNGYKTVYAHALLSLVKTGQYVEKGQLIGRVGNTGLSTGPHLHFEIRKHNVALDPTTKINKRLLYY